MKILHVTALYPPSVGGVERYVYNVVNEQRLFGNDVYVITSNFPSKRSFEKKVIRLPVLCRPRGKWGYIPICPTIFKSLRDIESDVIHVHTPPKFFAESAALYRSLKKRKQPMILTYHLHNESLVSLSGAVLHVYNRTVMHWLFRSANKVIALSDWYRSLINRVFGVNFENIKVVPCGVDEKRFDPNKYSSEESRKKFQVFNEHVIVFMGRLIGVKGVSYLIRALPIVKDELSDASVIIVGDGILKSDLQALSRKLNVHSSVKFMGHIPDEDIPRVLSMTSILVLPSLSEGLPLVLLEAMSMEKPVVTTCVGGVPDVVIDGKTGILVEKKNIHELASAIVTVLSDKKLARNMGRLGKKLVQEKYRWTVVTKKMLDVYKNAT